MEYVYCVFRVFGEGDSYTAYHLASIHLDLEKAKESVNKTDKIFVTSRRLYSAAHVFTDYHDNPHVMVIERVRVGEINDW